jgi:polar amino acid transport system substrate-binding protein
VLRQPSARCRQGLATGEIDAMPLPAIALYMDELDFPLGPQGQLDSGLRMARFQFVLVRRRGEALDWDGRRFQPASPVVGVRRGVATLAQRLQGLGVTLDDKASANGQLLAKLRARRIDLAAMSREEFQALAGVEPDLEALPTPLVSTDLHLAVGRQLKGPLRDRLPAWREQIARLRDSPAYRVLPATAPGS